ncbi:hypothetical protein AwPolaro_06410 [Polaromonas sp.]|nr:hypothetical protein AwPolaro_06410 [Polaromonas sp.]
MKIKSTLLLLPIVLVLTACATGAPDTLKLQQATSLRLGLGSTDELSLTKIKEETPDALGGKKITYLATTARGRKFNCSTLMMPGLPINPPSYSAVECTPA